MTDCQHCGLPDSDSHACKKKVIAILRELEKEGRVIIHSLDEDTGKFELTMVPEVKN